MVFDRASLPCGGCIVNMANQTTPANASLNQTELCLDDSGSSPRRFIDWVVNPLIPSEPTEIFKPVYPCVSGPWWVYLELLYLFFHSFIFLSLLHYRFFKILELGETSKIIHKEIFRAYNCQALVRCWEFEGRYETVLSLKVGANSSSSFTDRQTNLATFLSRTIMKRNTQEVKI